MMNYTVLQMQTSPYYTVSDSVPENPTSWKPMTCPSHTTTEHYHTAPPKFVQSTVQHKHTAYIMRCSLTELRKTL